MHAPDSLAARLFCFIPSDLIALIARISIGTVFFRSGLTKIDRCKSLSEVLSCRISDSAYYLFANEYKLPLIPPNLAANLATLPSCRCHCCSGQGCYRASPPWPF